MRQISLLIFTVIVAVGCTDNNQGELVSQPTPEPGSAITQEQTAQTDELPAGHPPIQNQQPSMADMGIQAQEQPPMSIEGNTVTIPPISFEIAENWTSSPPSSSFRAAQFVIPPAEGQIEPAELAVFQGITGTQEQNIERWKNQIQLPQDANPDEVVQVEKREVGEFNIQTLDITGTYVASMGPMMGGGQPQENYRMIAAAVDGPGGPWHFKMVGPAEAVAAQKDTFEKMLSSLKKVE